MFARDINYVSRFVQRGSEASHSHELDNHFLNGIFLARLYIAARCALKLTNDIFRRYLDLCLISSSIFQRYFSAFKTGLLYSSFL